MWFAAFRASFFGIGVEACKIGGEPIFDTAAARWSRHFNSGEAHHAIASLKTNPFYFKKSGAMMDLGSQKDKKLYLITCKQKINYRAYHMKFPLRSITLAICASALGTSLQLQAGTITVANTDDTGTGSLRAAIAAAINGDTIDFNPALNGATITLTSAELSIVGKQLTIDASSLPSGIKISGNDSFRIFLIQGNSNISLNSLDLLNGKSSGNGGGVFAVQSILNCVNITIRNCVSSFDGGGLAANTVTGYFDRCSFLGNNSGTVGGGVYLIGATVTFTNSVISGNRALLGGGMNVFGSNPEIINCTIQGNSGAGIRLQTTSAPNLRNTIVWGNRSGTGPIASQQIENGANADVNYCLIEGAASTLNNLNGTDPANDPDFVNPANPVNSPSTAADLRVFTSTPVLNVGDNDSYTSPPPLDRDRAGKTRVQDATIDLGAYEGGYVTFGFLHHPLVPAEDFNGNGISNFVEYASGIDPSGPDNPAARPMITRSDGINSLTTSQRSNAADVVFSWETSTSLETLSWQEMVLGIHYTEKSTSNPSPDRKEVIFKLLDTDPSRFYRQGFLSN